MNKGQDREKQIKNILKFFKMNEDRFTTLLGILVVCLVAGMIFNYFKSANLSLWKGSLLSESAQSSDNKMEEESKSTPDTYKVVKGDDLWHISEKYYKSGYNYVDIIKENKLSKNGLIEPGMELRLPRVEPKKLTVVEKSQPVMTDKKAEIAVVPGKAEIKTIETGEYTTQKGDSFWNIAVKSYGDGYQWTKIYWANRKIFGNPNLIHANVKIVIPALEK